MSDMLSHPATPSEQAPRNAMPDMKFEFVVLPVANADRSKKFYSDIGWKLDMDFERADG